MPGKKFFIGSKRPEYYSGLLMKADTGLHEQIAAKLLALVPPGGTVMDLGAGEGALAARLRDAGYVVTAVDVDRESFKAPDVRFEQVNFDDPVQFNAFVDRNTAKYDAVLGIEVIEHIQDQWTYVRQLMKLAKPNGVLLITTPHTTSWISRFMFFFTGQFYSFDSHGLTYGHISPVSPWELRLILESCGARDVVIESAGTLPPLYLVPTREVLINLLVLPFRPLMRGLIDGWCVMVTARRP